MIGEAAQLVFIVADTKDLAWELWCVVAQRGLPDAVVLVPPVNERDVARRWAGLMNR